MRWNQNENRKLRGASCEERVGNCKYGLWRTTRPSLLAPQSSPSAFTLTELLVVITIIAILASLITGAAINALNRAKQAAITLEIGQLAGAMESFKEKYSAYPPNVYPNVSTTLVLTNNEKQENAASLLRMLKMVANRGTEFQTTANPNTGNNNFTTIVERGLSPSEALVFWLQGFSNDVQRPLSGSDLQPTSIDDNGVTRNGVITIDSFDPLFDFKRGRLRISREPNGDRRFLTVYGPGGTGPFEIQLYEYLPSNSQEPYVYFDTSREKPQQVVENWVTTEFFYSSLVGDGTVYPLKKLKVNVPLPASRVPPLIQYVEYVEQGKFQILHCGIDDAWGDFSESGSRGQLNLSNTEFIPPLLFPEGPFLGDIADTVGNFMTGTLADEQE